MWLGLVGHVVDPPLALLDAEVPPLGLGHQVGLGHQLGQVLGKHDMPVLELLVVVFVRVEDVLVGSHLLKAWRCDSKQTFWKEI